VQCTGGIDEDALVGGRTACNALRKVVNAFMSGLGEQDVKKQKVPAE